MNSLPKYLKISVCSNLNQKELTTMIMLNKLWYKILTSDDFWLYKLISEYGEIAKTRPIYLSCKEWYHRLHESGNIYECAYPSHSTSEKKCFIKENVQYHRHCSGRYYYIDVWDQLWYVQLPHSVSRDLYGLTIDYNNATFIAMCNIGTYLSTPDHPERRRAIREIRKVDLLYALRDVHPTTIGDFLLTRENQLYFIGLEINHLTFFQDNIKSIGGTHSFCFYITLDQQLYTVEYANLIISTKFIANNVSCAFGYCMDAEWPGEGSLLYFTRDNKNYMWNGNETILTLSPPETKYIIKGGCLISNRNKRCIETDIVQVYANYADYIHYIKRRSKFNPK